MHFDALSALKTVLVLRFALQMVNLMEISEHSTYKGKYPAVDTLLVEMN